MKYTKFAEFGLDRVINWTEFCSDAGLQLNLGAGKKHKENYISLDADMGWMAPKLPYDDKSVKHIVSCHFFEHLNKEEVIGMLRECERVMISGSTLDILVPYYKSQMAYHDLDHKTFYTEATFKNLFECPYYDGTMPRDWTLSQSSATLFGLVERNLSLIVQITKS